MTLKNIVTALVLATIAACASDSAKNSENVEEIYTEANRLIERGRYIEAGEHLQEIRTRFPQSRFAALAELRSADMNFNQDLFTEAAAGYGVFVELYPNHADAAYAQYRRALSYFNDAPEEISRDQAPARDAAAAADQLIKRYPQSEYAPKGEELYRKSRLKLAEKEAYVARFYERRDAKLAAYRRWRSVSTGFEDIKDLPEAKAILATAAERVAKLGEEIPSAGAAAGAQ